MRKLFLAAVAVAALFVTSALQATPTHAQLYGSNIATLGVSLTYGQSEVVILADGQQVTVLCEATICPAGEAFAVNEGVSAYSYGASYGTAAYISPYLTGYSVGVSPYAYSGYYTNGGMTWPYAGYNSYGTFGGFGGFNTGCVQFCSFGGTFGRFRGNGHPNESGETEPVCPAGQHESEHSEACH